MNEFDQQDAQTYILVNERKSRFKSECTESMAFSEDELPLMKEEHFATKQDISDSHNNLKSESSCNLSGTKDVDLMTNKPQESRKRSGNSYGHIPMVNVTVDQHKFDTKEHTENKSISNVVNSSYLGKHTKMTESVDKKSNNSEINNNNHARNLLIATFLLLLFLVIPLVGWSVYVYLRPPACEPPTTGEPLVSTKIQTNVIQSATFNMNRTAHQLIGKMANVNVTWQNQIASFLRSYGDTVVVKQNGTFHIVATINLDTSSVSDKISSKVIDRDRFRSLSCINMSRYTVDEVNTCQRTNLPPYTAVPVTLGPVVVPLMKGDRIWVSVLGINQVQRIGTKLVITQYLGGIG
ncbi:uncharacterized protein LOC127725488 [Mytilus californianus]|uniref:uncharacterized protein LOC127725488 n=1 Tax=Mytilus californianus TaxID=6549 RepID=UPI002247773F|nr:uncharacterized protein LOC127725488 [Mytilus californianus]